MKLPVVVNGKSLDLAPGTTIADLVAEWGFEPRAVAVERNGEIVPRSRWAESALEPGDRVEVVRFVQGG